MYSPRVQHPYQKHPPNRAVWDDCTAGMDYKGACGVLAQLRRWVPTCSAKTAPAHPAGQCRLAFVKPTNSKTGCKAFAKSPVRAVCASLRAAVPEHGCHQKGDLSGSATTQAQHSKPSHAVESVQNPGTTAFSYFPLCPGEHHCFRTMLGDFTPPATHSTSTRDVPHHCGDLPAQ